MKEKLVIVAILFIIAGFGMMHSLASTMEVVSLLMIGIGAGYLLFLLLKQRGKK